jgi:DNA-binding MarR family transcriptional regulator
MPRLAVHPPSPAVAGSLAEFEEVAGLVAQARRKVWSGVSRVLVPEGEAVLGWALVSVLARLGPRSQRDLSDIIGQHPAGISRQLDELDAAGLTTRTEDASDRRCRLVALTPRGRRWHQRFRPKVLEAVRDVLGVLDAKERDGLRRALEKVVGAPGAVLERGRPKGLSSTPKEKSRHTHKGSPHAKGRLRH